MRDFIDYIPLQSIVGRVLPFIPDQYLDESQLLEWASEAMEDLLTYKTYEKALCFTTVTNHIAEIPVGLYGLELIMYKQAVDDIMDISGSIVTTAAPTYSVTTSPIDFLLNSPTSKKWKGLAPSTSIFSLGMMCEGADHNMISMCEHTYSIDIMRRRFLFTFDAGDIAIAYLRAPMNDDGDFLIPNKEYLKRALEAYLMRRVWEVRTNMKEEGAGAMLKHYINEYQLLSAKAVGEQMMPSLTDYANLSNLNKLVREDSKFAFGLGNLGFTERMYFR
jgi:hypothetical protein